MQPFFISHTYILQLIIKLRLLDGNHFLFVRMAPEEPIGQLISSDANVGRARDADHNARIGGSNVQRWRWYYT